MRQNKLWLHHDVYLRQTLPAPPDFEFLEFPIKHKYEDKLKKYFRNIDKKEIIIGEQNEKK